MVQSHLKPIYFNFIVSDLNHIVSIRLLEEVAFLTPFTYVYVVSNFREAVELILDYGLTLDSD